MSTLNDYLTEQQSRFIDELLDFLRIPSVSTDRGRDADVRRAAEFVTEKLNEVGLQTTLLETDGHPAVFASLDADPDAPTVLVYGHYDVQPPDPLNLWETPPFEPTIRDGVIYARGASDDKGQVYAHIKGAQALRRSADTFPVNLKFLIEGEEEIGSPNLGPLIERERDRLACDVVVISDSAMLAPDTPTITYGLKGLAYIEVRVRGANTDLHSGAYGGGVPNPINDLAKMIAALHDDDGRVTVPGFYDDVIPISDAEQDAFARVPFDQDVFMDEIEVSATPGEAGYTLLERLWARPTLDVNGIGGGFQGTGAKTVIASEAFAKISCRLVPDQDPDDIATRLADYLIDIAPDGLFVEVKNLHGGDPALTPLESPAVQAAASALRTVYDKEPVFARTGGTIPVVSAFQSMLDAQVVLVGLGLENDRAHAPNEKFDVSNYLRGIEVSAELFRALAEMPVAAKS